MVRRWGYSASFNSSAFGALSRVWTWFLGYKEPICPGHVGELTIPKKVTNRRIASQKELTLLRFSMWTLKTYLKHQTSGGIWMSWDTVYMVNLKNIISHVSSDILHPNSCFPGCLNHQQKERNCVFWTIKIIPCPRCSMYGIFTYIYHKFRIHVDKYTSPMEPIWDVVNCHPGRSVDVNHDLFWIFFGRTYSP